MPSTERCNGTEAVLNATSTDVAVIPNMEDRAPLQGAEPATINIGDHIGVVVSGEYVVVESVRFWTVYARKVKVTLYSDLQMTQQVDVSVIYFSQLIS